MGHLRTNLGWVSPYVRTVKTASGARAVQIVHSSRGGKRDIEHIGSAHSEADLAVLTAVAYRRLAAGQEQLDLGLPPDPGRSGAVLPITATRMGPLLDALTRAYQVLGFDRASGRDAVFAQLVAARVIEPTSKLDALRVLEEAGMADVPSYRTLTRHLPRYAKPAFAAALSRACAAQAELGRAALVLFDVSTLYFETDAGDGFREPGFSKERRLEPQITIGLLTDARGFPLQVNAFEGNKAETATMLPVIRAFMAAHQLQEVTVVADAGMFSTANKAAIEAAGLSFILATRHAHVPDVIDRWRRAHPEQDVPDGLTLTQPWPAGPADRRRDQVIYYRYSAERARRTLHGIAEQVNKAERAVAGKTPVKRNRFVQLSGAKKSVNRDLEAKAKTLAGWKGYATNLPATTADADFVISAYHQLLHIEKSFRMSKHDLAARPIYHHKRESIEAHLNIVFAALAISRWIESQTGWSIKKFVTTTRRYRTIEINAGGHTITAAHPLPADLAAALQTIHAAERPRY